VVAITGDGGMLYGIQELATAVKYRINVVTVLFNNNSYGNVRRDQIERYGGRLLGVDLHNPDFMKLTESFGALGLRASTPAELKAALTRALAADLPVVIEVPVSQGKECSPWPFIYPTGRG
jgi:acetolactate synthase I/II/III large subunit